MQNDAKQKTGKPPINDPIAAFVASIRERIAAALPADKPAAHYYNVVVEYLMRNPDLLQCDRQSLAAAIIDAALLGLELGPPFELATIWKLKPKKNQPANNVSPAAKLIVEYRGHLVQVYRTGRIKSIEARPVYANDQFDFNFGDRPALLHRPTTKARGPLVHAYAIAQLSEGGSVIEVINQYDADRARADSAGAAKPDSLWKTRTADMWIKTAIKRLVARMPRESGGGNVAAGRPAPDDYEKLIKACLISPDLYRKAINDLDIDFPHDLLTLRTLLSYMRSLYVLSLAESAGTTTSAAGGNSAT